VLKRWRSRVLQCGVTISCLSARTARLSFLRSTCEAAGTVRCGEGFRLFLPALLEGDGIRHPVVPVPGVMASKGRTPAR